MGDLASLPDEELLDRLQRAAFGYFLTYGNPANGLVADTSRPGWPASIAVVGFSLSAQPVAVERGWTTRPDAIQRVLSTLRFFWNSPQGEQADATGHRGFFYHFLDMQTGRRVWQCELSPMDTALLLAGFLMVGTYFSQDSADEAEIRALSRDLYDRVDWEWAQDGKPSVSQGWKPESGFLHYGWDGYNEAIILYVLGLGSPAHPLSSPSYAAWTTTYQWENLYGHDFLYAGPLFIHQFSHTWIDFRGIRDGFMREKGSDYFTNSQRAAAVQREYARRNPLEFAHYGADCWGLSAGDGPIGTAPATDGTVRRLFGYSARGVPYGPDDGTLSPPALLASLPFSPAPTLSALRHLLRRHPHLLKDDRLPSGFNPAAPGGGPDGWISDGTYGLDQGIVLLMIENHRSDFVWKLMRNCPVIKTGLRRAGFRGGWLQAS